MARNTSQIMRRRKRKTPPDMPFVAAMRWASFMPHIERRYEGLRFVRRQFEPDYTWEDLRNWRHLHLPTPDESALGLLSSSPRPL